MRTLFHGVVLCGIFAGVVFGQEAKYPYPQTTPYPYGFMPKGLTTDKLKTEYDRWKKALVSSCSSGEMYVNTDGSGKVEAVGFGMLNTVYMGEKKEFDAIYSYYKKNCNTNAGGMMGWIGQCGGNSNGSATDGDVDVAFALIVASWQWPDGDYEAEAKKVISVIRQKVVKSCSDSVLVLAPGYSGGAWGGCDYIDISYFNPAAFREYAKVCDKADSATWVKLADDTYIHLNRSANSSTGLVPDWQTTSSGAAGGGGREGAYKYDACRAPWRIALDYLWNGNEKAKAWCLKISDWANKVGPANIKDGYSLSGGANGGNHNMCFTGGFGCAAMCNTQAMADAFAAEMSKIASRDNSWFTFSVGIGNMITMTGNQWRPTSGAKRAPTRAKETGSSYLWRFVNGNTLMVTAVAQGTAVILTTLSGQRVATAVAPCGQASIATGQIPPGCYILSATHPRGKTPQHRLITISE